MRGAPYSVSATLMRMRIIPADAGSTTAPRRRAHPGGDHPRGCGEHVDGLRAGPGGAGSSPRMRGALPCCKTRRPARGIIPADAGSTQVAQYKDVADRDHPRGCGEHSSRAKLHACDMGSSPRMRGARSRDYDQRSGSGIIPADAGSTADEPVSVPLSTDHPRGCGEHGCRRRIVLPYRGSSPRMRGAP